MWGNMQASLKSASCAPYAKMWGVGDIAKVLEVARRGPRRQSLAELVSTRYQRVTDTKTSFSRGTGRSELVKVEVEGKAPGFIAGLVGLDRGHRDMW
jgi:hypothetical protein